jgi:glycosyl transferase family 2
MPLGCAVGKPWSSDIKVVAVPNGMVAKPVTIVLPFYEAHEFLQTQWQTWWSYPEAIRRHLSAIIVDDGSPRPVSLPERRPFSVRLFRIEVDIAWNWLAARNIGAHHAQDGWLLLTDMDHVVPPETAHALVCGEHDQSIVYAFSRREHTGEKVNPHSASFFMTRRMFWTIGGYDERLSGVYGTDGTYRKRVASTAWIRVLKDELIRYEYVADSSVTQFERKTPAMREARSRRFASVPRGSTPTVLSFPYREVAV